MSEGILDDSIMHLMNPQNPSGNFHILLLFFVNYLTSCLPASQISLQKSKVSKQHNFKKMQAPPTPPNHSNPPETLGEL